MEAQRSPTLTRPFQWTVSCGTYDVLVHQHWPHWIDAKTASCALQISMPLPVPLPFHLANAPATAPTTLLWSEYLPIAEQLGGRQAIPMPQHLMGCYNGLLIQQS